MRRSVLVLVVAALVVGCTADEPEPTAGVTATPAPHSAGPSASEVQPEPEPTPTESPEPTPAVAVPEPGRPYEADAILSAMRGSRRPGGVPDQLETREVAEALAARIWTIGGEPWEAISASASCGLDTCLVEIGGTPAGAVGEDLYVFEVDQVNDRIVVIEATLQGLEPATVEALDLFARDEAPVDLAGFALASARWLPPPDDGRFVLAYRSGGEEGSPRIDLLVDVDAGTVTPMPEGRLTEPGSG